MYSVKHKNVTSKYWGCSKVTKRGLFNILHAPENLIRILDNERLFKKMVNKLHWIKTQRNALTLHMDTVIQDLSHDNIFIKTI